MFQEWFDGFSWVLEIEDNQRLLEATPGGAFYMQWELIRIATHRLLSRSIVMPQFLHCSIVLFHIAAFFLECLYCSFHPEMAMWKVILAATTIRFCN